MQETRLHPLNQGFIWPRREPPFRLFTAEEVKRFDDNGFLLLKDVISPKTLSELIAEIDPLEAAEEENVRQSASGRTFIARPGAISFTVQLVKTSKAVKDFASSKLFQDITYDLIGSDVRLYWDQAVYKKPDSDPKEFPYHQDNGYTFISPQAYLTCWVPLVDATVENGCPWVVPGLHKQGTLNHDLTDLGLQCLSQHPDGLPVPAKAGSVVIFSSLTPHRTGPNLTQSIRKALILQFAPEGARKMGDEHGFDLAGEDGKPGLPQNDPVCQFLILKDGKAPV